jgi:hypothetical protein
MPRPSPGQSEAYAVHGNRAAVDRIGVGKLDQLEVIANPIRLTSPGAWVSDTADLAAFLKRLAQNPQRVPRASSIYRARPSARRDDVGFILPL